MPNNISTNRIEPGNITNQNTSGVNRTNQNTEVTENTTRNTRNTSNTTSRSTNIRLAQNMQVDNEPIIITTSLETKITYYVWIKDINGNTSYQTLKIDKAPI